MQYTITKIVRFTTKKDGTPLVYKDRSGQMKPYTSVRIQVAEMPDVWISGFGNQENQLWVEGVKVDIEVTKKMSADGTQEYLNFSTPNWKQKIEKRIAALELKVFSVKPKTEPLPKFPTAEYPGVNKAYETPDDDDMVDVESIPF